jgi:hypothetical protein
MNTGANPNPVWMDEKLTQNVIDFSAGLVTKADV